MEPPDPVLAMMQAGVRELVRTFAAGGALTMTHTAESEPFATAEGLRALLIRLHEAGPEGWRRDPEAAQLMQFVATKYEKLARKHGLDRWEVASAAFDIMRAASTRNAENPWKVVGRALKVTCWAEERARGLLCSTHQARRESVSRNHDAERISDREHPITNYHPAFHVPDPTDALEDEHDGFDPEGPLPQHAGSRTTAAQAMHRAVWLFAHLGWHEDTARAVTEHVCQALTKHGNRHATFEVLRRDRHARALLDLPKSSWQAALKVLLGTTNPALAATAAGRGLLLRLVIGEPVEVLLHDDELVLAISLAAPRGGEDA